MEQGKVIVRSSLEKEDFKKYLVIDIFSVNKIIAVFLISCVVSVSLNYVSKTLDTMHVVRYFAIFFGIVMLMRLLRMLGMYRGIGKMYDEGKLEGHNIYSFADDSLTIQNSAQKGSTVIKYEQIGTVKITKDFVLMYANAKQCSVIRIKDVEDMNRFTEFLQQKFGKKLKK